MRSEPPGAEELHAARAVDRVGALCRAGIDAPRAWRIVAARDPALRAVLDAPDVAAGLAAMHRDRPDGPWADVAVLWTVAARTGAPTAPTLEAIVRALRDAAGTRRAAAVALAGPTTSGRVVLALPVLGLLLGGALGTDVLGVLVGTPIGVGCVVGAALLVLGARSWTARLVRAATPDTRIPGMLLDAWAVALSGGGSWSDAERTVGSCIDAAAVPERERALLDETLDLARDAGVPAAGLLRALADDLRRDAATEGLVAAERLAVRLVLPLGVCVLPAFVLVGIVPVVVGILSSTLDGLG